MTRIKQEKSLITGTSNSLAYYTNSLSHLLNDWGVYNSKLLPFLINWEQYEILLSFSVSPSTTNWQRFQIIKSDSWVAEWSSIYTWLNIINTSSQYWIQQTTWDNFVYWQITNKNLTTNVSLSWYVWKVWGMDWNLFWSQWFKSDFLLPDDYVAFIYLWWPSNGYFLQSKLFYKRWNDPFVPLEFTRNISTFLNWISYLTLLNDNNEIILHSKEFLTQKSNTNWTTWWKNNLEINWIEYTREWGCMLMAIQPAVQV